MPLVYQQRKTPQAERSASPARRAVSRPGAWPGSSCSIPCGGRRCATRCQPEVRACGRLSFHTRSCHDAAPDAATGSPASTRRAMPGAPCVAKPATCRNSKPDSKPDSHLDSRPAASSLSSRFLTSIWRITTAAAHRVPHRAPHQALRLPGQPGKSGFPSVASPARWTVAVCASRATSRRLPQQLPKQLPARCRPVQPGSS